MTSVSEHIIDVVLHAYMPCRSVKGQADFTRVLVSIFDNVVSKRLSVFCMIVMGDDLQNVNKVVGLYAS